MWGPCQTASVIVVSGTIQVAPDRRDDAVAVFAPVIAATNEEAGCISYHVFEDPWQPGRFRLFEEWTDQASLDDHLGADHMATFRDALPALGGISADIAKYVIATVGPLR